MTIARRILLLAGAVPLVLVALGVLNHLELARIESRSRFVASTVARTAGMPCSRAMIAGWASMPPPSATSAPAWPNATVQLEWVVGHTSTSPGRSRDSSDSVRTTRTGPVWTPGDTGTPRRPSPSEPPVGGASSPFSAQNISSMTRRIGAGRPRMSGSGTTGGPTTAGPGCARTQAISARPRLVASIAVMFSGRGGRPVPTRAMNCSRSSRARGL